MNTTTAADLMTRLAQALDAAGLQLGHGDTEDTFVPVEPARLLWLLAGAGLSVRVTASSVTCATPADVQDSRTLRLVRPE